MPLEHADDDVSILDESLHLIRAARATYARIIWPAFAGARAYAACVARKYREHGNWKVDQCRVCLKDLPHFLNILAVIWIFLCILLPKSPPKMLLNFSYLSMKEKSPNVGIKISQSSNREEIYLKDPSWDCSPPFKTLFRFELNMNMFAWRHRYLVLQQIYNRFYRNAHFFLFTPSRSVMRCICI